MNDQRGTTDMSAAEPPQRTTLPALFFYRFIGGLLLKHEMYAAVAQDAAATRQAAVVVCLSALAQPTVLTKELGVWAIPIMLGFGLMRWCLFAAIAYGVGRLVARKPLAYQRLLRCLGFAEAPAIFSFVAYSLDPPLAMYVGFFVWFWMLSAAVVAVRAAFSVSGARAAVIAVLSFLFYLAPGIAFGSPTAEPMTLPTSAS
jgi:hypothetical protein